MKFTQIPVKCNPNSHVCPRSSSNLYIHPRAHGTPAGRSRPRRRYSNLPPDRASDSAMANGRKMMPSRRESLLGSYGHAAGDYGTDLLEEDVWSMVDGGGAGPQDYWTLSSGAEINGGGGGASAERRRVIPPGDRIQAGGLSMALDYHDARAPAPALTPTPSSPMVVHQFRGGGTARIAHSGVAASAPVSVPDWHRILVDSAESMPESWNDDGASGSPEAEWVPPHEYLARSRKAAATSVFEGVGRTLKGRDLSRVRDAVWSQTGFDG